MAGQAGGGLLFIRKFQRRPLSICIATISRGLG
jgi:hypothetical protein